MSLYRFLILVSSLLLASMDILAMPEEPPPHSLSPTLNGLNIATLVKKDRAKLMLYVINHEKFPVICDAQYKSGPEKSDQPQITIPAGKADFFKFNYGRHGDDILLELVCVDPRKQADPHHEAPASQETPNAAPGETPADDTP